MTMPTLIDALAWAAAGGALAGLYLYLIGRTVAAMQPPAAHLAAAAWLALRVAAAAATLGFAATQGAAPLLLALAGFLVVRTIVVRQVQRG